VEKTIFLTTFAHWLSIFKGSITNAAFFSARELVFTVFTRAKTLPKHSHELEISWSQVVN